MHTMERYFLPDEIKTLFFTIKQMDSLLAKRDLAWMQFLLHSGVRIGAFAALSVGDAKKILRTKYMDLAAVKRGKSGNTYIKEKARKALEDLLRIRSKMGYTDIPDEPLVYSRKHKRLSVRSYQSRLKLWLDKAGLDVDATPHWFRHTFSHHFLANTTATGPRALVLLAKELNHTSLDSTMVYTRPGREEVEQAMEEV